jgi:hypothetical protein
MQILEISYGKFLDVSFLNPNFRANSTKIRVVLDVFLPQRKEVKLKSIHRKMHRLMPTLSKHRCCLGLFYGSLGQRQESGIPMKRVGDSTDVAHMIEHMIIDLQANISGMDSCSGITCGYTEPDFRFDLFVECKDKDVARFSSYLSLAVMKRALSGEKLFPRYQRIISLAKYLYRHPQSVNCFERISKDLNLPLGYVPSLFQDLIHLRYFSKERLNASDTKREERHG